MPPALASGEIRRKGTAVVTTLIGLFCAIEELTRESNVILANKHFAILFIVGFYVQ
jgi:hypothetical protein